MEAEGSSTLGKRKREFHSPHHRQNILGQILRLGDRKPGERQSRPLEPEIEEVCKATRLDVASRTETVIPILLDCAVEVSSKTTIYATLAGLWGADEEAFGPALAAAAAEDYSASLAVGDRNRARLLLRLCAALTTTNVLQTASVLAALDGIVQSAVTVARQGDTSQSRLWQPYSDYLVYSVLIALPWMATELAEGTHEGLQALLASVAAYMQLRPRQQQTEMSPFPGAERGAVDGVQDVTPLPAHPEALSSDSGGASFLGQLWEATQELSEAKWVLEGVPTFPELEAGFAHCQPVALPALQCPTQPPGVPSSGSPAEVAAAVQRAFPPRGELRLLPPAEADPSSMDRIIIQEYVIDTLLYFDADHAEMSRRLMTGIFGTVAVGAKHAVVMETIFAQMLCLPTCRSRLVAYGQLLLNLCHLDRTFPKPLTGCVKALMHHMPSLDVELRLRLAEWLSLHVSNGDFHWPWASWAYVADEPGHNPRRQFVALALEYLSRLSYPTYLTSEHSQHLRLHAVQTGQPRVAEALWPLLGPSQPALHTVLPPPKQREHSQNGDEAAPAAAEDVPPAAQQLHDQVTVILRAQLAGHPVPAHEKLSAWLAESEVPAQLGGSVEVLRWLLRSVLVHASTHSVGRLDQVCSGFKELVHDLLEQAGREEAEVMLVEEGTSGWRDCVQRSTVAVERLLLHGWIAPGSVVRWLFSRQAVGMQSASDPLQSLQCWDLLQAAMRRAQQLTQEAQAAVNDAEAALQSQQVRVNKLAALPEQPDGDEPDADAQQAQQQQAEAAVQSATGNLHGKQDALQRTGLAQQTLVMQIIESFIGHLAAMEPAAEGEDEAIASYQAWRTWTLGVLQAFLRGHSASLAPVVAQLQKQVSQLDDTLEDVRAVFNLYCNMS